VKFVLNDSHSGSCGGHLFGLEATQKILRAWYFWLTILKDCNKPVKKCHQCQVFTRKMHAHRVVTWDYSWLFKNNFKASQNLILIAGWPFHSKRDLSNTKRYWFPTVTRHQLTLLNSGVIFKDKKKHR
jgi:hypothetical protein